MKHLLCIPLFLMLPSITIAQKVMCNISIEINGKRKNISQKEYTTALIIFNVNSHSVYYLKSENNEILIDTSIAPLDSVYFCLFYKNYSIINRLYMKSMREKNYWIFGIITNNNWEENPYTSPLKKGEKYIDYWVKSPFVFSQAHRRSPKWELKRIKALLKKANRTLH